jgi:hypothetical protein
MLCSNDWKHRERFQQERSVQMQLELFPLQPEPRSKSTRWARLTQDEREAIVRKLARLMARAVRPMSKRDADER